MSLNTNTDEYFVIKSYTIDYCYYALLGLCAINNVDFVDKTDMDDNFVAVVFRREDGEKIWQLLNKEYPAFKNLFTDTISQKEVDMFEDMNLSVLNNTIIVYSQGGGDKVSLLYNN